MQIVCENAVSVKIKVPFHFFLHITSIHNFSCVSITLKMCTLKLFIENMPNVNTPIYLLYIAKMFFCDI